MYNLEKSIGNYLTHPSVEMKGKVSPWPKLLEAWLALLNVNYNGNLKVSMFLTMLRATDPGLKITYHVQIWIILSLPISADFSLNGLSDGKFTSLQDDTSNKD